jgi:GTPase
VLGNDCVALRFARKLFAQFRLVDRGRDPAVLRAARSMASAQRPKAVLVAVKLPGTDDATLASSLAELERLVTTLGYDPVATVTQARHSFAPAAVIGEGKLEQLAELTGGTGQTGTTPPKKQQKKQVESGGEQREKPEPKVQLVAVDHDITPSQARNLERASGVPVLDRTGVIIEIFHRHARTREARLQVEIARLAYTAPRLRESPSGKERQRGRGAGEAALELDRRRIRDRIAELRAELVQLGAEQGIRRQRRRDARRVALVGYTNAGKSSLMRALTGSNVLVEDRLFATLDTTVRALHPESRPRILISDTVGFIKKLPHDLVASFKSTLDEAADASLLLQVVDGADPDHENQIGVSRQVLGEIGADSVPTRLVMNKTDMLEPSALEELREKHPDAWFVSAFDRRDMAQLRSRIVEFFEGGYSEETFVVPYDRQKLVHEMHEHGRVEEERYEEHGVIVRVRSDAESLARLRAQLVAD